MKQTMKTGFGSPVRGRNMDNKVLFNEVYKNFKMYFYQMIFGKFAEREATLTAVETFCMEVIYAMDKPTINEFASFIKISSPNAAYKINSLEKKGYLKRVQSQTDKREHHLEVTQKYIDYYNIVQDHVNEIMKKAREEMSTEEWDGFCHGLEVIRKIQLEDQPDLDRTGK